MLRLSELLERLDVLAVKNFSDSTVTSVEEDSERVTEGTVFVARRGVRYDGNDFIRDAVLRGACAVVTEDKDVVSLSVTTIISKNATKTMAEIAKAIYGDVLCNMTIIGITGTKGKTSTAKILSECILSMGKSLVTVGTLGAEIYAFAHETYSTENTTPNSPFIYKILHRAYLLGAKIAVIEVSSQALAEHRVYGIPFSVCIFTNLSYDHIGIYEHKSFEEYVLAKRSLFTDYGAKTAIVNSDIENSYNIAQGCARVIKVGVDGDVIFRHIKDSLYDTEFMLDGNSFKLSVGGEFNGMNAAMALIAASEVLNVGVLAFSDCLKNISIPGRYEVYSIGDVKIIIDFAHNGQSLKSILKSVRTHTEGRIILVFGSVGERCRSRRGELAAVAEKFADISVITSDNPGNESPQAIADEIYSLFNDKRKAVIITERERAIAHALKLAKAHDTVLLVGKGQESYQLTENGREFFSEREIIERAGASKER